MDFRLISIGRRKHLRFLNREMTDSEPYYKKNNPAQDIKQTEVGNRWESVRPLGNYYGSSTGAR